MIRDMIPAPVRKVIYAVLGAGIGVNAVLGVLDDGVVAKVVGVAAVLGFTMAASNVPPKV